MIQGDMSFGHNLSKLPRDIDLEFVLLWLLASVRTTRRRSWSLLQKAAPTNTRIQSWLPASQRPHRLQNTPLRRLQRNKRRLNKLAKRTVMYMKESQRRGWNMSIASSASSIITEHHVYTPLIRYLVSQPQQESQRRPYPQKTQTKPSQSQPSQRNSSLILHRTRLPQELSLTPKEQQVPTPALYLFAGVKNETKVADSSERWPRVIVHFSI